MGNAWGETADQDPVVTTAAPTMALAPALQQALVFRPPSEITASSGTTTFPMAPAGYEIVAEGEGGHAPELHLYRRLQRVPTLGEPATTLLAVTGTIQTINERGLTTAATPPTPVVPSNPTDIVCDLLHMTDPAHPHRPLLLDALGGRLDANINARAGVVVSGSAAAAAPTVWQTKPFLIAKRAERKPGVEVFNLFPCDRTTRNNFLVWLHKNGHTRHLDMWQLDDRTVSGATDVCDGYRVTTGQWVFATATRTALAWNFDAGTDQYTEAVSKAFVEATRPEGVEVMEWANKYVTVPVDSDDGCSTLVVLRNGTEPCFFAEPRYD